MSNTLLMSHFQTKPRMCAKQPITALYPVLFCFLKNDRNDNANIISRFLKV